MKNKSVVFKEYSTALLTIGSVIAGTFNCLFYYVYDIWNILLISTTKPCIITGEALRMMMTKMI